MPCRGAHRASENESKPPNKRTTNGRPYKTCAQMIRKTNIGDFSGSRWPLKNRGSYCSVSVQSMLFCPQLWNEAETSHSNKTNP